MNRRSFSDKVVVITGSTRGIGRMLASRAAEQGAAVVVNGRDHARLRPVCEGLRARGFPIAGVVADVSTPEGADALVDGALGRFGRIDALVCNAGISMRASFETAAPSAVKRMLEINVLGAIYPAQAALPSLRATRGSLFFVSSLAGLRGLPRVAGYSASKMALTAVVQSLRCELHGQGIHVGLGHVAFTENDPDKRIYDAAGNLVPIEHPFRPRRTQEQTADWILRCVRKRRAFAVQTLLGAALAAAVVIAPGIVDLVVRREIDRIR